MSILKKIGFAIIPLLVLAILTELAVRVYYYQKHARYVSGISALYHELISLKHPAFSDAKQIPPLIQGDAVVGFKSIPGVHELLFVSGKRTLKVKVTIADDGYRITSANPEMYANKPEIWIFGCSFTYGWGINDEETYPWLLQLHLPAWRIRNLGMTGFGNVQALLQLEHAISTGERLPAIALFVYNPFHRERNVGAYSFVSRLKGHGNYLYPIGVLTEAGTFDVQRRPIGGVEKPRPDPDECYENLVTKAIFYRLWNLCISHHIRPLFGLQSGLLSDPIAQYAMQRGFTVIDFSVDLMEDGGRKYRILPFDPHPNRLANTEYARRLLPDLQKATAAFETAVITTGSALNKN